MNFPFLKETPDGVVVSIQVQPRSSRNQLAGIQDDWLKLKLTSPPVDGAANKACRDFLAKLFRIPKTSITIISGETSRQKRILLSGADLQRIAQVVGENLA